MALNPFNQLNLGWLPNSGANTPTSQSLSTGNRAAFGFVSPVTSTLASVRIYVSGITSAPATTDFKCGILANGTAGAGPTGAALEEKDVASTPSANAWHDFTGFTQAVVANTMYWVAFRNNTAAPSCSIRTATGQYQQFGTPATFGNGYRLSTDSGANWTASSAFGRCTCRITLADGTTIGFPVSSERRADTSSVGDRVQSAVEVGTLFTTPANVKLKVRGLIFKVNKTGSPAGTLRFRLYRNTTLVDTTGAIAGNQIEGSDTRFIQLFFATDQELDESTNYRVVYAATGADAGGNYFASDIYVWDTDADSDGMKPFWGTAQKTVFTGTWTDTANEIIPCALILADPPFTSLGGGGGGGTKFITRNNLDSV